MSKATQINPGLVDQVFAPSSRPSPVTDCAEVNNLKLRFMQSARAICPEFRITPEQQPVIAAIFDWCIMRPGRLDPHKGLWLHGEIGSGKTTMLHIVRHFCRDHRPQFLPGNPYSFRISNAIEVCSEFSRKGYDGIETFINSRCQAFDELGSESSPTGYYGTAENVFQYILQRRYERRHSSFTHVTTNFTVEEIPSLYGARIYDRCRELFNFVELNGESFRQSKETRI